MSTEKHTPTPCVGSGQNFDALEQHEKKAAEGGKHICPFCSRAVSLRQGPNGNAWRQIPRHNRAALKLAKEA